MNRSHLINFIPLHVSSDQIVVFFVFRHIELRKINCEIFSEKKMITLNNNAHTLWIVIA